MKKLGIVCFVFAFCALFFTACEKQEPIQLADAVEEVVEDENVEVVDITADDIVVEAVEEGAMGRSPGPDLIIPIFSSNLPLNGNCAIMPGQQPLPNATCNGSLGGSNSFFLGIRILNNGNQAVAPGTFNVAWSLTGLPIQGLTIVNHPGIPVGGTISLTRNWALRCPTSTPIGLTRRTFGAIVDVNNNVAECDETNNGARYIICDDI